MYFPLPAMFTRKPGEDPSALPLSITHVPSSAVLASRSCGFSHADSGGSGPSGSASHLRFVNHDESATSSRSLALTDSPHAAKAKLSASGRKTMLSAPSQMIGDSYVSGAQVTCFGSFSDGFARQGTDT